MTNYRTRRKAKRVFYALEAFNGKLFTNVDNTVRLIEWNYKK